MAKQTNLHACLRALAPSQAVAESSIQALEHGVLAPKQEHLPNIPDAARFPLMVIARELGIKKHANARISFERMAATFPALWEHVETVREHRHAGSVLSYHLDGVALACFLFWRQCGGRLPAVFCSVETLQSEGVCHASQQ